MGEMADDYSHFDWDYFDNYDQEDEEIECQRCGADGLVLRHNHNNNLQTYDVTKQDWHRCPASRVFDVVKV